MKCLMYAGGYSTRLGALTDNLPKPMIKIAGRPVIEHILTRLSIHGINQVIINVHYLKTKITDYIGERALYYYSPRLLGHLGTINALRDWLGGETFMVVNSDTMTDVSYTDMLAHHKPGMITALMDENRCCGTWIYDKEFFNNPNLPINPYRPADHHWFDVGTIERLAEARKYYETDFSSKKP